MVSSKRLFLDPNIKPEDILEDELAEHYAMYCQFMEKLNELECVLEWYYFFGAWYCKVMDKEEPICQLSAWATGLELHFVFEKKAIRDIEKMDIDDHLKEKAAFLAEKFDICLLTMPLKDSKTLDAAVKVMEYSKNRNEKYKQK